MYFLILNTRILSYITRVHQNQKTKIDIIPTLIHKFSQILAIVPIIFSIVKKGRWDSKYLYFMGFPGGASGKEPACQWGRYERPRFNPWVGKILWRRAWLPTPVLLPGEAHGQRNLVGYSPCGCKDQTRLKRQHNTRTHTHTHTHTHTQFMTQYRMICALSCHV